MHLSKSAHYPKGRIMVRRTRLVRHEDEEFDDFVTYDVPEGAENLPVLSLSAKTFALRPELGGGRISDDSAVHDTVRVEPDSLVIQSVLQEDVMVQNSTVINSFIQRGAEIRNAFVYGACILEGEVIENGEFIG